MLPARLEAGRMPVSAGNRRRLGRAFKALSCIKRSMANSSSMRLTASMATGAFCSSANSKNLRRPCAQEVKDLRRQSQELKEVVAEQALELRLLKKSMTGDGGDEA